MEVTRGGQAAYFRRVLSAHGARGASPIERLTRVQEHDSQQSQTTRREFLSLSGRTILAGLALTAGARASEFPASQTPAGTESARGVVERLLPNHAEQIHLRLAPHPGQENLRISGSAANIRIEGSTISSLLIGLNWYLKYVAGVSISWNGDCLDHLPARLPAPGAPISIAANVGHRFALNDTNDGYTGPYWSWPQWERQIDVLALHGIREVLVYTGAEAVYQRTFRNFHLTDEQLRRWFPTPAHQPWWLLENISGWVGPSISQHLIDRRLALAQKVSGRLRELGMVPVMPGYFGILPDGFAAQNRDAHIVPQGEWLGMKRPDWLDPTCDLFATVAAEYYRTQKNLLGPSSMFKMDPMHEGGQSGDVSLTQAARAIQRELQKANPGAIWAVLGWQKNPRRELLAGISDKESMLILDGQSDRYAYEDREQEWANTPYAFGTIWNFGGHTTMGANAGVWNERYHEQRSKPGSRLSGIAVMPEASCNNPAAFAFFTELAWRSEKVNLQNWFSEWSAYRYGGQDSHASRAWQILGATAYSMPSGTWSEAQDNLFAAQPDLHARSACTWSPKEPRYDLKIFATALEPLLRIDPSLRNTSAYRYDLVDVARQVVSNRSRVLLPRILAAYTGKDLGQFQQLTDEWLKQMDMLDRIVATEPSLLMGRWIAEARAAAEGADEQAQLEFDACSLLLEWGPAASRDSGIHDYANREWNGLLTFYRERWAAFFAMLQSVLEKNEPEKEIDWFAMDVAWSKRKKDFRVQPQGDFYDVIRNIVAAPFSADAVLPYSFGQPHSSIWFRAVVKWKDEGRRSGCGAA